jgi:hypothetical protein
LIKIMSDSNDSLSFGNILRIGLLLLLVYSGVHFFHLEENVGLVRFMPALLLAFGLYWLVETHVKLPLLFLLNAGTMLWLLGIQDGLILVALGLLLFGITELPLSLRLRIGLVIALTLMLALLRADWLPSIQHPRWLPVLGALFMFRMILYLYELQHERTSPGLWLKLNYFFLLPNLVFLIFPVVDYQTFVRGYQQKPAYETAMRGIRMIANGLFHLLLYRLLYYYFLPAPSAVEGPLDLLQFIVISYALITRLAGIFHFSAGVVCLFGFYLPHTFEHYFFTRSFSDIWRRVNIYWREFMTKVFYMPLYFKIKHWGQKPAIFVSVSLIFVLNWFLHGYQWFWLRGSFPLTKQDILFWGIMGVLVAHNSVTQASLRPGQRPSQVFGFSEAGKAALSILSVFLTMCVLWSLWTSDSIDSFLLTMHRGLPSQWIELLLPAGLLVLVWGLGVLFQYVQHRYAMPAMQQENLNQKTATGWLLVFALAGTPLVYPTIELWTGYNTDPIRHARLNAYDKEKLFNGYYETLIPATNLSSQLWEMEQQKPEEWQSISELGLRKPGANHLLKELAPNKSVIFKGAPFSTNSQGLRDKEYLEKRPEGGLRIALLGGSIEMGTGVSNEQTYENQIEDQLNAQNLLGRPVEILNFGIAGNHLFQNLSVCELKAIHFDANAVVYPAHSNEKHRMLSMLYRDYQKIRGIGYPYLEELIQQAGIQRSDSEELFLSKMEPFLDTIVRWGYQHIAECARSMNALPIWIFVPALDDNQVPGEDEELARLAAELGFYTLNLNHSFGQISPEQLKIAPWDFHPNSQGHTLIAQEFLLQLRQDDSFLNALKTW